MQLSPDNRKNIKEPGQEKIVLKLTSKKNLRNLFQIQNHLSFERKITFKIPLQIKSKIIYFAIEKKNSIVNGFYVGILDFSVK